MAVKEKDAGNQAKAEDLGLMADVVGGAGVALAVGGTVWGIVRAVRKKKRRERAAAQASVAPIVGPGASGAMVTIQF